ncbi:MAG: arsenite methyltransferase [Coriobacteriia bacterium]|nr:arsenite methyltransferase [Coriobacteriia bacterium]
MSTDDDIKQAVRERYAGHATQGTSCCSSGSCCGGEVSGGTVSQELGYSADDLAAIPGGADLGLGCGNPLALLELSAGETVLDLGSGGGIDCFMAARQVGPTGHVIGVDMTAEMIARARKNAAVGGYGNVEFRLGEIEHLPVADATVDAVISNCVINLVPDKRQAFAEAARVLKSGGRISVSDIVTLGEIPVEIRGSMEAYVACLAGAILRDEYLVLLGEAGFEDIRVTEERTFAVEDVVAEDLVAEFRRHTGATDEQLRKAAERFASIRVAAVRSA